MTRRVAIDSCRGGVEPQRHARLFEVDVVR
jgi:hypothetical protein